MNRKVAIGAHARAIGQRCVSELGTELRRQWCRLSESQHVCACVHGVCSTGPTLRHMAVRMEPCGVYPFRCTARWRVLTAWRSTITRVVCGQRAPPHGAAAGVKALFRLERASCTRSPTIDDCERNARPCERRVVTQVPRDNHLRSLACALAGVESIGSLLLWRCATLPVCLSVATGARSAHRSPFCS